MGVGYASRLSQSFYTYMKTVAVCFRSSIGVRCRRFLFARHLLAILVLDVSRRVIASVWLQGEPWFGIHGGLHLHCRRRGGSVASEDGFHSESLDRSQFPHLRAPCCASIILWSVPYYSRIVCARRNDRLKELSHVRVWGPPGDFCDVG